MSKLTESLEQQMKAIYGDSFGRDTGPGPVDLSEAISSAFSESRASRKLQQMKAAGKKVMPNKQTARKQEPRNRFANMRRGGMIGTQNHTGVKHSVEPSGGPSATKSSKKSGFGGSIKGVNHNPFQRSPNLGPGPRNSHHDERKCWSCKCGHIYDDGCNCTATGATDKCPKGQKKHITIHKDYHQAYNDEYHAWRKHPNNAPKFSGHRK